MSIMFKIQQKAKLLKLKQPNLRNGQTLMLALQEEDFELYDNLLFTPADCVHDDKLIPNFWAAVEHKWEVK